MSLHPSPSVDPGTPGGVERLRKKVKWVMMTTNSKQLSDQLRSDIRGLPSPKFFSKVVLFNGKHFH